MNSVELLSATAALITLRRNASVAALTAGPTLAADCEPPETGDRVRVRRRLQDAVLIIRRSPRAAWREAVDNQRGDAVPCEDVRLP